MTLHRKVQICNVTSQVLEQIAQFGSHLYGSYVTLKQADFLHFDEQIAYLFEM